MGFSVIPEPAVSGFTGPQGPAGTIPTDPTFDGSASINDTSGDPDLNFKKNGALRWKVRSAGTESGSNNGSDLWVEAFADDGTTKINDPLWISRTTGQVAIGIANSSQGGVKLSVNGAIGMRDMTDPLTTGLGAQLYSKAGKLWVQTANGAEKFQVVESLPSKANATLSATYMSIDKSAGNYRVFRWMTDGVSRWEAQTDDVAEAGSATGSDFRLSARNDDGTFNKTVIHARRSDGTITFGTTVHHGTAQVTSAGAVGLRDLAADPATTAGGVFLYSKAGLPYIKQADGTVFQVGAGGGGTSPVSSVNSKTGAVVLTASDVGALPTTGGTLSGELSVDGAAGTYREFSFKSGGVKRWSFQADNTAEPADGNGSDFRIFSRKDDGTFNLNGLSITRKWAQTTFGDNGPLGDAKATTSGAHGLRNITFEPALPNEGFLLYAQNGLPYIKQGDGTVFKVGASPVSSVNTKTGAVVLTASDVSAVPASSVGAASGVASLDSTTRLPIAQIPAAVAKNEWTPQALGFQAWSVDPGTLATPTTGRSITIGRTYLAGFNITEPTTVSKLFVFAAGWAGSSVVPAARFFAGLYKEDGTSLISSGTTALSNIGAAGQTTGSPTVQQNSHAGAVPFPFTGSVTLQPGRYWGAFLMSAGAATDFYYFYAQNEAATNTSIFHNLSSAFVRNAYVSGMANLTTSLTKANFQLNHDQMVMALA